MIPYSSLSLRKLAHHQQAMYAARCRSPTVTSQPHDATPAHPQQCQYDLIVFDKDGTLFDVSPQVIGWANGVAGRLIGFSETLPDYSHALLLAS
jgi:hypothetical protein